jgi:hypothetical protein
LPALVTIKPSFTAPAIASALLSRGINASTATCKRILHDVRADDGFGPFDDQFRQFEAFMGRERLADATTTTNVAIDPVTHKLKGCFISWGVAKLVVQHLRAFMTLDGAHLCPQGIGIVCTSFLPSLLIFFLFLSF